MTRFVRFNVVGVGGFLVQLATLAALEWWRVPIVPATCLAVEAAVVHNFVWHERWTWSGSSGNGRGRRFLRFHLANGLISIAGNAAIAATLVATGMPSLVAVTIAVLTCALLNFAAAHAWVYRNPRSAIRNPHSAVRGPRSAIRGPRSTLRYASCNVVLGMKWMFVAGVLIVALAGLWMVPQNRNHSETGDGGDVVAGSTASTPQHDLATTPNPIGTSGTHAGAAEDHGGEVITEIETITGATDGMELVGRRVDLHVDVQKRTNDAAFWVGSPDNRILVVLGRDRRDGVQRQRGLSSRHQVVPVRDGHRATIAGVIRPVPAAEQRYSWNLTGDDERELTDRKIYIRAEAVMSEGHGTD